MARNFYYFPCTFFLMDLSRNFIAYIMENSHNISNLYSIIYLQILEKRHFGAKSLVKVARSPYICHREKANIKYSQIIKPHTGAKNGNDK